MAGVFKGSNSDSGLGSGVPKSNVRLTLAGVLFGDGKSVLFTGDEYVENGLNLEEDGEATIFCGVLKLDGQSDVVPARCFLEDLNILNKKLEPVLILTNGRDGQDLHHFSDLDRRSWKKRSLI